MGIYFISPWQLLDARASRNITKDLFSQFGMCGSLHGNNCVRLDHSD